LISGSKKAKREKDLEEGDSTIKEGVNAELNLNGRTGSVVREREVASNERKEASCIDVTKAPA